MAKAETEEQATQGMIADGTLAKVAGEWVLTKAPASLRGVRRRAAEQLVSEGLRVGAASASLASSLDSLGSPEAPPANLLASLLETPETPETPAASGRFGVTKIHAVLSRVDETSLAIGDLRMPDGKVKRAFVQIDASGKLSGGRNGICFPLDGLKGKLLAAAIRGGGK